MSIMAGRRGIAAVLFLMALRLAIASHLGHVQVPRSPRIHIRLVDEAGVVDKVRAQAEATVMALYHKAGLEVDFVDCLSTQGAPCHEAPGRTDFWLQILKQKPAHLQGDSTGFAILVPSDRAGDSYAAVSLPMVESAATDLDVPVVDVLAASMAHEIGHLLLHSTSHTRSGIMSPRIDRRQVLLLQRGELLFSGEEIEKLGERTSQLEP